MSSKLAVLIREVIKAEVATSESHDQLLKGMAEKIFKNLIQTSEVSKFVVYLFKAKYERIDFDYFDRNDINKLFKQIGAEKMGVNERRKSSFKGEYELTKIEDIEYEVINYGKERSGYLRSVMGGGEGGYADSVLTNNISPNIN